VVGAAIPVHQSQHLWRHVQQLRIGASLIHLSLPPCPGIKLENKRPGCYRQAIKEILIISDFGEGSDTHPKKPIHIGCVASYRDTGNDLTVQLGF
jgi:hypothetical protein